MNHSRPMIRRVLPAACSLLFVLFLFPTTASAQTVTPSYYVTASGSCNVIPFSPSSSTTFQVWQGFFAPGMFTGAYAGNISKIYFKYCNSNSGTTYSNFQVQIATSNANSFATTAWYSPMTTALSSTSYYIPSGSTGNWFAINLTTPVYYNPSHTLIIKVCSSGHTGSGFGVDHGYDYTPAPFIGRLYGGGAGCATTAPSGSTANYIPSFGFDLNPALPDDAGISELVSPVAFCAGTEDIKVKLMNFGTNTLNSVTINWSWNGVPQTPISWNTPLPSLSTATVTLGTRTFTAGVPYNLVVWTSNPNNTQDSFTGNDSLVATLQASLEGTYTIGGVNPDYPTFAAAVSDLNTYGVCGPIVFNVRSGTYDERVVFTDIAGTSAINTVTFQSETGNRNDVLIRHTTNALADNGVVVLGGASFLIFRNMTMRNLSNGTYCSVVELGSSTDCTIESCELISGNSTYTGYYAAVVNGYGANNHRTTIRNCGIRNGGIGLYMYGTSNLITQDYCVVEGNEITGAYYTAYYSYYQGYEKFHDNYIELGPGGYTYTYLSFFYYGHDASVERNRWFGTGRTYCYGVYFYYQNYYVSGQSRFVNNMVTLTGHQYPYRAMYKYYSSNTLMAHNTFWMNAIGSYPSSYLIYDYNPSGCTYYNNILYQMGDGLAWYVYNGSTMVDSDYNLFYTNGSTLAYWNANMTTLTNLQTASGMDKNSLVKTVFFKDVTTGDLHLVSPSDDDTDLFGLLLQEVTEDIDHEARVQPYLGADEACYITPGSVNYSFVDEQGMPAGYAEAPGTIGLHYSVAFPEFDATIVMTVSFLNPVTNQLVYQTTLTAQKLYGVTLDDVQYITLPPTMPPGAYKIEVSFWTKNSCNAYRDYMPYPSALLVVPEGRIPCVVWPGDVNNDGIVSYADRRDLNKYIYDANLRTSWLNGPQRYQADAELNPFTYLEWKPQAGAPWQTPEGCYMDTDGNGVVNNLDYIAQKLNWSKYTPWYAGAPKADLTAPSSFMMDQNYPNPFNPVTMIRYHAPEASHVRLVVSDALGRQVAELVDGRMEKGIHETAFDGTQLSSGTYIATITMTGVESGMTFSKTIKMVLNK